MYLWLLKEYVTKEYQENYKCEANMLVVETIGAFNSKVFGVTNNDIILGFKEFTELLKRVAFHECKGYDKILEFVKDDFNYNLDISL